MQFLEKESCYRIPKFDIYTTANHGCLEEMSIAELREALVQVKQWHKDEEERKHQDVMQHQLQVNSHLIFRAILDVFLYYIIST